MWVHWAWCCWFVPCALSHYNHSAICVCLYRSCTLELDQFPHIIPSVNTSPRGFLSLGYRRCLNLESPHLCKTEWWPDQLCWLNLANWIATSFQWQYKKETSSVTLQVIIISVTMPWPFSESIKKRACRYLLHRYLGNFLQEKLSLDQLSLDLYQGTGSLAQVPLDKWVCAVFYLVFK